MEESDDQPKAKAPAAANPNPNNSSKIKEGELFTPSNDNKIPLGSATQLDSRTSAQKEPLHVPLAKENVQFVTTGKALTTRNPSRFVASRSSVQPNHRKKFEPFIIRFYDDESSSDSDEYKTEDETLGVAGRGKLPAASFAKSQMVSVNARKDIMVPGKVSLGRTFVSSMTKTNRTSSKNGEPLLGEQKSHVKRINIPHKTKAGQEHGCNPNGHLNSSELQDLRQLIAIRENELKLKVANQKKEPTSGSCRNASATNVSNKATRRSRETPDFEYSELKEPDRKRLKITESHSVPVNSDGRQGIPALESTLVSAKSVVENGGQRIINNCSCLGKEIALGTTQRQQEEEKRGTVFAATLPIDVEKDTAIIPSGNQCSGMVKLAGPSAGVANRPVETSPKKSCAVELRHPIEMNHQPPSSSIRNVSGPNKTRLGHNSSRSCEFHEIRSDEKSIEPVSGSFWNSLGKVNISGTNNMDIQTLLELEELQDDELEEAQEHRRKCEIEERNALRAYRKAQRAMMEANSRCSYLYRKRELYSAHFCSCMMDNPSMVWSSRLHDHLGAGPPNSSDNMPEVNMHVIQSSHQMESKLYDSNVRSGNGALQYLSDQHEDGHNWASNPCSEADANAVGSQSSDLNISADEDDETFPIDHEDDEANLDRWRKEETYNEKQKHEYDDSKTIDNSQDSLLLEASLRYQLFERLRIKNLINERGPGQKSDHTTESTAQDEGEHIREMSTVNLPVSETEKDQPFDLEGSEREERNIFELPVQIKNKCHVEKLSSSYGSPSIADPVDNLISNEGHPSIRSISNLYPILRSVFCHMKVVDVISLVQSHAKCQKDQPFHVYDKNSNGVSHYGIDLTSLAPTTSTEETSTDICFNEIGSYSSNPEIDPLWPLCMYDLRGKCNDDECTWQHVRGHSRRNMNNDNATDGEIMSSPLRVKSSSAENLSKSLDLCAFAPPSYLVCSDILKADSHPYKSVLAQSEASCWQKSFSTSLVLSNLLPTSLPLDEPILHGPGARIESYGSWNRQLSYFHSRSGKMTQLNQQLTDNDESLEMALLSFSQEVNKQKGRIEALKVLARALEADPTCAVLWIVYLHVYYSNQESVGKDDMFKYSVGHNEGSYELWLMYIYSRERLEDRLVAYDTALSALSRCASSSSERDSIHDSECFLDLFLQMINTFCISGNVDQAIEKIYGLLPSTEKSDGLHGLLLPDILSCLTIWDKCIFWVCCMYLIVYKKLPDSVVLQFECKKQLSPLEWRPTRLTVDDKQQAVNMMEMAIDSLALYLDSEESLENDTTLKAAHMFALNHVGFIAMIKGVECCKHLLDNYIKLYPSCLELVLMAARANEPEFANSSIVGFEEALGNWLEDVPGVHCIWSQYAEFAFQNETSRNFVKELMDGWFHSVWEVQFSEKNILDGENSFELLNLALHKLLQNDQIGARSAIDQALNCASPENYEHVVREHAVFWLTGDSQSKDASVSEMLRVLNRYLGDKTRAFPVTGPLSRSFIQNIKKPLVRQLVSNLFSPVSSDSSLVNLVLEVWYGPSLLPQEFDDKVTDLVDFVEAVLEFVPANYQLAISLCKMLSGTPNLAGVGSSVSFWASSILVEAVFRAVPVAPEYIWVEAASVLRNLTDNIQSISMSFHKRALAVYPFSMKLWRSYLDLPGVTGKGNDVIEAARSRGIELY